MKIAEQMVKTFVRLPSGERFSIAEIRNHGAVVHPALSQANKSPPCSLCQAGRVFMTYKDRAKIKREFDEAFEKMKSTPSDSPEHLKAMDEFEPKFIALLDTWGEIEFAE